jgi:hypothetical protein
VQHWTNRRKASLAIHVMVVLIPLVFGTISALLFWHGLFKSWWVAAPMVAVIDVLALLGLILFICRIESPFVVLRHALPFVSIVPLGVELWQLLTPHNTLWVTVPVTVLSTAIMVGVAWRCYVTIERLFVDPVTAAAELMQEQALAARQRMTQQVQALTTTLTAMAEQQQLAVSAIQEWSQRPQLTITAVQPAMPALTGEVTAAVSTQAVKAYAELNDVSERTVWRQLKNGKVSVADILGEEG